MHFDDLIKSIIALIVHLCSGHSISVQDTDTFYFDDVAVLSSAHLTVERACGQSVDCISQLVVHWSPFLVVHGIIAVILCPCNICVLSSREVSLLALAIGTES